MCEQRAKRIPAARLKAVPWTRFREEVSNAEAYRKAVDKPEMKPAGRGLNGPLDFLVFSSLI